MSGLCVQQNERGRRDICTELADRPHEITSRVTGLIIVFFFASHLHFLPFANRVLRCDSASIFRISGYPGPEQQIRLTDQPVHEGDLADNSILGLAWLIKALFLPYVALLWRFRCGVAIADLLEEGVSFCAVY